MSRKSTGVMVTSISCSGTCLILSIPRQPKVSAVASGPGRGGRAVEAIARRTAAVSVVPVVVDNHDPVGQLVGLLQVLRAEQDRRPLGHQRPDDLPDLTA